MANIDIDDVDVKTSDSSSITPAWALDLEDHKAVIEWTKKVTETLVGDTLERREWQRANCARYQGQYSPRDPIIGSKLKPEIGAAGIKRWPRIVINHTRDLVDQKTSKLLKIRPNAIIVPAQNEPQDEMSAIAANDIINSVEYSYDIDLLLARLQRRAIIFGEAYLGVNWDSKEKDVALSLIDPERIFLIPGPSPLLCKVPGCIITEVRHIEEVRADYDSVADQILPTKELQDYSYDSLEEKELENHVLVYNVWYRSSKYCPNGLYWKCTAEVMLEEPTDNPIPWTKALEASESGNLPFERITDIDLEGTLNGWSSMMDLNVMQNQYDKLTSLISRNIFLFCHPKWNLPPGCNPEQLSDGSFFVKTTGGQPPTLLQYNAVTQEVFAFWDAMEKKMEKIFNIYAISRGDAPAGTRAASQMMIYDEQEEETRAVPRKKIERLACGKHAKILAIASKYYAEDKERLALVMGDDKKWMVKEINTKDLQKDFVVRTEQSNALPDNKYARIRTLLEMNQMAPGLMSNDMLLHYLDMGQHEKFIDYARVAYQAAEFENQCFIRGTKIEEPALYEDLITHWKVHAKLFQNRTYKMLSSKQQQAAREHMLVTEYLMQIKKDDNMAFGQQLLALPAYPLFFVQGEAAGPGSPGAALPNGSASMGQPPNMLPPGPMPGKPTRVATIQPTPRPKPATNPNPQFVGQNMKQNPMGA